MKVRFEEDGSLTQAEVVIRHPTGASPGAEEVLRAVSERLREGAKLAVHKGDAEVYLEYGEIIFFETGGSAIYVHTAEEAYATDKRLYELEKELPAHFARISKSAIVNADRIRSIDRPLASSGLIRFRGSHKAVYVSRRYYKNLKKVIDERMKQHEI